MPGALLPPRPKNKDRIPTVTKSMDGEFAEYKEMVKRIENSKKANDDVGFSKKEIDDQLLKIK